MTNSIVKIGLFSLAAAAFLTGCTDGGSSADTGSTTAASVVKLADATAAEAELITTSCENGGEIVYTGIDSNNNGILDLSERDETPLVLCNGADGNDGTNGENGHDSVIDFVELGPEETDCTYGATAIYHGTDLNSNGILDADERSGDVRHICHDDNIAPELNIAHGSGEDVVTHATQWIYTGTAGNEKFLQSVVLEQNGEKTYVDVAADGTFAHPAKLNAGTNRFTLTATDGNGNTSEVNGTLYLGYTTAAGGSHSGALKDGKLYTWGRNNLAQTGLGYNSDLEDESLGSHPTAPVEVTAPTTNRFVSLSFNQNYSLALDEAGNVWSWGANPNGELGRGDLDDNCSLTASSACVKSISSVDLPGVVLISAGYSHALALKSDGTLWAWGTNGDGELGTGDANASSVPVQVNIDETLAIVQVSAGSDFTCALDDQGRIWAWGKNNYGQMGQGDKGDDQLSPVKVPMPADVKIKSVAAGKAHILALAEDGTVYGWGLNSSSQIGYYGYQYKETEAAWDNYIYAPMLVLEANATNPVVEVFANGNSSYVVRADKKIYPWGQFGETTPEGDQEYTNLDYPEDRYASVGDIKDLAAGALHIVATQADDTIFTFKWNFEGSLGGGETTVDRWFYNYPIKPVFPEN